MLLPTFAHADNTVYACVGNLTKIVRDVGAGGQCLKGETAVQWNITGPQGAQGIGSPGPAGAQGIPGNAPPSYTNPNFVARDLRNFVVREDNCVVASGSSAAAYMGPCDVAMYPATVDSVGYNPNQVVHLKLWHLTQSNPTTGHEESAGTVAVQVGFMDDTINSSTCIVVNGNIDPINIDIITPSTEGAKAIVADVLNGDAACQPTWFHGVPKRSQLLGIVGVYNWPQ